MGVTGNELVTILGYRGDYRQATVKLKNIDGFYWSNTNGQREDCTGNYNLHGFLYHTKVESGDLGYGCICGCYPYLLEVYIPKDLNKECFDYMANIAGEKPEDLKEAGGVRRSELLKETEETEAGQNTLAISITRGTSTSAMIREIVEQQPGITAAEIEDILAKEGMEKNTIRNSIRYLKTNDFKTLPKLRSEIYGETEKLYLDYSSCG